MNIYDFLVDGINKYKNNSYPITSYLESLQPSVKMLRRAYRNHPVYVDYKQEAVQNAYLITYLPHYYQLIEKVLREQNPDSLAEKSILEITFIGGGPGSEVFGTIKHITSHNPYIKEINVNIMDINADAWSYSHQVVQDKLIGSLGQVDRFNINWKAYQLDITDISSVNKQLNHFRKSDLVVIQNCINEIANENYYELSSSMISIFNAIPSKGALLMIDLTQSVRSKIKNIEKELTALSDVKEVVGTMNQKSPSRMISINARPNEIVRQNLLNYTDGLIPRKNLSYDYSFISKSIIKSERDQTTTGINTLYAPLADLSLNEVQNRTFIGFDFGTSVSVCTVAFVKDNELHLKSIEFSQKGPSGRSDKDSLVPTVIGVASKQYMVGKFANDLKAELELGKNSWYDFKNNLGCLDDVVYNSSILKSNIKKTIGNAKEGLIEYFKFIHDGINKYCKENGLSTDIYYNISIPANYPLSKKLALRECLDKAGITYKNESFSFEAVSALIYSIYNKTIAFNEKVESQYTLVIDIGAGTLDVTVLEVSKDGEELESYILAIERIDEYGGQKVDNLISEFLSISENHYSEQLKHVLCKSIPMDRSNKLPELAFSKSSRSISTKNNGNIKLSYSDLFDIMNSYHKFLLKTINLALHNSGITIDSINNLILSGGGGKNPYTRSYVQELFSKNELVIPDDIQEQVARGNALQSFVQNSYGKNLINTCLGYDISISKLGAKRVIFKKGITTPSLEKEIFTSDLDKKNRLVLSCLKGEVIIFNIPPKFLKALIYINADHDVSCEVITEKGIVFPKVELLN